MDSPIFIQSYAPSYHILKDGASHYDKTINLENRIYFFLIVSYNFCRYLFIRKVQRQKKRTLCENVP